MTQDQTENHTPHSLLPRTSRTPYHIHAVTTRDNQGPLTIHHQTRPHTQTHTRQASTTPAIKPIQVGNWAAMTQDQTETSLLHHIHREPADLHSISMLYLPCMGTYTSQSHTHTHTHTHTYTHAQANSHAYTDTSSHIDITF